MVLNSRALISGDARGSLLVYGKSPPLLVLRKEDFVRLVSGHYARIKSDGTVIIEDDSSV